MVKFPLDVKQTKNYVIIPIFKTGMVYVPICVIFAPYPYVKWAEFRKTNKTNKTKMLENIQHFEFSNRFWPTSEMCFQKLMNIFRMKIIL